MSLTSNNVQIRASYSRIHHHNIENVSHHQHASEAAQPNLIRPPIANAHAVSAHGSHLPATHNYKAPSNFEEVPHSPNVSMASAANFKRLATHQRPSTKANSYLTLMQNRLLEVEKTPFPSSPSPQHRTSTSKGFTPLTSRMKIPQMASPQSIVRPLSSANSLCSRCAKFIDHESQPCQKPPCPRPVSAIASPPHTLGTDMHISEFDAVSAERASGETWKSKQDISSAENSPSLSVRQMRSRANTLLQQFRVNMDEEVIDALKDSVDCLERERDILLRRLTLIDEHSRKLATDGGPAAVIEALMAQADSERADTILPRDEAPNTTNTQYFTL